MWAASVYYIWGNLLSESAFFDRPQKKRKKAATEADLFKKNFIEKMQREGVILKIFTEFREFGICPRVPKKDFGTVLDEHWRLWMLDTGSNVDYVRNCLQITNQ